MMFCVRDENGWVGVSGGWGLPELCQAYLRG